MVISSLVVDAVPGKEHAIADQLVQIDGVEVHSMEENRIVVTIEAETVDDSHAIASGFINIEGVMNINLVYANFEDDPSIRKA
ncbi:chaperone NapD [Raoultibacter phocaeensis]|uniref:chaperone NapD n=1 Tax=Raoultibacter phocaeensis TaxID=2479841 RepID=UPI00111AE69A|nr:chaperone NapD [Raoultibacter phocaeensis]